MADDTHERLARLETQMGLLVPMVRQTADDVRAVRDHMLTEKGRSAGRLRSLSLGAALMTGCGTVGAMIAAFLHH